MNLNGVIEEAMDMILNGNNSIMQTLRIQYANANETIEKSEVGCYVNYSFTEPIPLLNRKEFEIGDVYLQTSTLFSPIGFILYIRNGHIDVLELHTYGDDLLPLEFNNYSFYYATYSADERLPWYRERSI